MSSKLDNFLLSVKKHSQDANFTAFVEFCVKRSHLFSHALDYLNEDKLTNILADLYKSYQSYLKNQVPFLELQFISETAIEIRAVQKDRPFIIDSILLFLKSKNLYTKFILHPSIALSGEHISVVYCVIENFSGNIDLLKQDLKHLFDAVCVVTEDWEQMIKTTEEFTASLSSETAEFVKWLNKKGLILLSTETGSQTLGLKKIHKNLIDISYLQNQNLDKEIIISKSQIRSFIHRDNLIDIIKLRNKKGEECYIYGMFTTAAGKTDILDIPLLNRKVKNILQMSGFVENGYNWKEALSFMENLRRNDLFEMQDDQILENINVFLANSKNNHSTVLIQKDAYGRFLNLLLFLKKDASTYYNKSKIITYIYENISKDVFELFIRGLEYGFITMEFIISNVRFDTIDIKKITDDISDILLSWEHKVLSLGQQKGVDIVALGSFISAVSEDYKKDTNYEFAFEDFKNLHLLNDANDLECRLFTSDKTDKVAVLRLYYKNRNLFLYNFLPILSNFGVNVLGDSIHNVYPQTFVHEVNLEIPTDIDFASYKQNFEEVLKKVLTANLSDSTLNALAINPCLNTRKIMLLRGYEKYLQQINFPFPLPIVEKVLVSNPKIAKLLTDYFYAKFDPEITQERNSLSVKVKEDLDALSNKLTDPTSDRIIKTLVKLIDATLRTNFFVKDGGFYKDYISYKFDCRLIPDLPAPVPFREIFVYAKDFEAVHLRGGKVARGGLRWSDRQEDFRTEILGLIKAQTTKNTIVVPVGAKGGFVIKADTSKMSREEFFKYGQDCYTRFLCGCLDIVDNIIDRQVVHPKDVVCHDGEDYYFVAAADKGTATFSDLANSIAAKYNFWLGDAFASGGSNGYDHKKMGITSKGAWVAVRRHFMELGIDPEKQEFTCVGIGDLSGDVFGNGMLRSRKMKLLAAFNHLHIFIDPNPNPETSFLERQRIFNLPRSSWMDYDLSKISNGGAIYERNAKTLTITPEIQSLFGIKEQEISPNELIKIILKADVDLIWNGGIGTYFKHSQETHLEVGDKANNFVRVNGADLRCKIVGEGGNLGFTQRGRIEYALKGGRINTDAMDNSGGVDCSDHEVNIKIILNSLTKEGKISLEERNQLLLEMTPEVESLVLRDNHLQTLAISVSQAQGLDDMEHNENLLNKLESLGILDRKNEFLPLPEELSRRKKDLQPLTRPELCVLFAYSKIYLYAGILNSNLIKDSYFTDTLLQYFPSEMQKRFASDIISHPLKNEIIATCLTNEIINRLGITFVEKMSIEVNASHELIVKSYYIISHIFNLSGLYANLDQMEGKQDWNTRVEIYQKLIYLLEDLIFWLLENEKVSEKSISAILEQYKTLPFQITISDLNDTNISAKIINALNISRLAKKFDIKFSELEKTYHKTTELLSLTKISNLYYQSGANNFIERIALKLVWNNILSKYSEIIVNIHQGKIEKLEDKFISFNKFIDFTDQFSLAENKLALLLLVDNRLQSFINA